MISRSDYHKAVQDLATLTTAQVRALFAAFVKGDPKKDFSALLTHMPALVGLLGLTSAQLAAAFYDAQRLDAGVSGGFLAQPAAELPSSQIADAIRWASVPVLDGDIPSALDRMIGSVTRLVLQPGRDTIAEAVTADPAPARYIRVPDAGACGFCLMVCSNTDTVAVEDLTYHDHCGCGTIPVIGDQSVPKVNTMLHDAWESTDPRASISERQAALVTAYAAA